MTVKSATGSFLWFLSCSLLFDGAIVCVLTQCAEAEIEAQNVRLSRDYHVQYVERLPHPRVAHSEWEMFYLLDYISLSN